MKAKDYENTLTWLMVGSVVFVIVVIFLRGPLFIIRGIVGLLCGYQCFKWATRIKKHPTPGYLIGFFFGLFGLLGYYIYYRVKKNKLKL